MIKRYEEKEAQVLGLSTDPVPSVKAWATTLGGVSYPLLSDFHPHGEVVRRYGVFNEATGLARRSVFIIDKEGVVERKHTYEGSLPDPAQVLEEIGVAAP